MFLDEIDRVTDTQKLEILKLALQKYKEEIDLNLGTALMRGLCYCIDQAIEEVLSTTTGTCYQEIDLLFPDFKNTCIRHGGKIHYSYYWARDNTQDRIETLQEMINNIQ